MDKFNINTFENNNNAKNLNTTVIDAITEYFVNNGFDNYFIVSSEEYLKK